MPLDDVTFGESRPCLPETPKLESTQHPTAGSPNIHLPLLHSNANQPNLHKRKVIRYIILAAVVIGIIIAVVCAAVLTTRNKHRSSSPAAASSTPGSTNHTSQDDVQAMTTVRLSVIVGSLEPNASSVPTWLSSLGPDGKWPDSEIDYTAGCKAQGANWPAEIHWSRIATLAAAWHGGLQNASQSYAGDHNVRSKVSLAMGWWFSNDFSNPACLLSGGQQACPCGTQGLWNTNWFANVILAPKQIASTCLLLGSSLTPPELGNCSKIATRAYGTFKSGIVGGAPVTGANTLDVATIGIDQGLLTSNTSLLSDAFDRVHAEVVVQHTARTDGIRDDGSFAQHGGIIYNGNYGKDYTNDAVALEIEAADTAYQAQGGSRTALETLIDGDQWMMYRNTLTNVLHWDFSVLGRFIVLPVADDQATAEIHLNLTQLQVLGQLWGSNTVSSVYNSLIKTTTDANAGSLVGNRMFYANDYMVHRGSGYVASLRMFSNRTQNTECVNTQNPSGFHLSDGTVYTYLKGDEYEDISAAWDWNLIPGTTVDYGATPLSCANAGHAGLQSFVGGASDGSLGVAAMRYQNPMTKNFSWQKTWFFLPGDVQHVMITSIPTATHAPVFSVLDQRKHDGNVYVDGNVMGSGNYTNVSSLWHGGVGYTFNPQGSVQLSLEIGTRTGDWSKIGTSHQPPVTADLFAAWLNHLDLSRAVSYSVFPGTTLSDFQSKSSSSSMQSIRNDGSFSAMSDGQTAMIVFWQPQGGSIVVPTSAAPVTITSNGPAIIIVHMDSWNVTVAEPTQTLSSLSLTFALGTGSAPSGWSSSTTSKSLSISLPSGGVAGSSVSQALFS